MLTIIDEYTGRWQKARRPTPPKLGATVRIHESADDRECDDFKRCLRSSCMDLEWVGWMPRNRMNVYKIISMDNVDCFGNRM